MTLLTPETTEVSVAELHDLQPDDFQQLYIEVSRRVEPGAGAFTGVPFLTASEDAAQFDTVADALAFIDALHADGIPGGIREAANEDLDDEGVVDRLQYSHDDMGATEYLEEAGITDPFNLEITPMVERLVETQPEDAGNEVRVDS